MSRESSAHVLAAIDQMIERDGMTTLTAFRQLLQQLLTRHDVRDCHVDLSLTSVVLCRFPRAESRHKPVLVIRPATSRRVVLEFQVTHRVTPAIRRTTESANCSYDTAEAEFDRLLALFLGASGDPRDHED